MTISEQPNADEQLMRIADQYAGAIIFAEHRDARVILDAAAAGYLSIEVLRSSGKWRLTRAHTSSHSAPVVLPSA